MARVTVEDCVIKVPNRFELVLLAAQRVRDIADVTIPLDTLQNNVIKSMQKHVEIDEPEEDHDVEIGAPASWAADLAPLGDGEEDEVEVEEPAIDAELQEDMLADADVAEGLGEDVRPNVSDSEAEPSGPQE